MRDHCKGLEVCQGGRRKGILGDGIRQISRDVGWHTITGELQRVLTSLQPLL